MPFISWLSSTYLFQTYLLLFFPFTNLIKFQVSVVQNAPDHKQRTLEPPVLRWRTLASYAPLRAEGSESVPAVVCAFCATSLVESCVALNVQWAFIQRLL